jgi:hypothetical protein
MDTAISTISFWKENWLGVVVYFVYNMFCPSIIIQNQINKNVIKNNNGNENDKNPSVSWSAFQEDGHSFDYNSLMPITLIVSLMLSQFFLLLNACKHKYILNCKVKTKRL